MRVVSTLLLVVFVAALVVATAAVPAMFVSVRDTTKAQHAAAADAYAVLLSRDRALLPDLQRDAAARQNVRVTLIARGAIAPSNDLVEYRAVPGGVLEIRFPDTLSQTRSLLRLAIITVALAIAAALAALGSRSLSVGRAAPAPDFKKPTSGSDRSDFIQTFERSIRTFKDRESELARLHQAQKERADELASMTATLSRSITAGFVSFDEEACVIDLNPIAREILAIPPVQTFAPGTRARSMSASPIAAALDAAIAEGRSHRREIADGQRLIEMVAVPLLDEREHRFGSLALLTDLTPLRRLQTQMQEMEALATLGEMSAGIAHEFRNSLSAILGYLRLARRTHVPPEVDERIAGAEREARQLAAAVESLLNFARPMELYKESVDVRELARRAVEQVRVSAPHVSFELGPHTFEVNADAHLLLRAVENLLRNAAEAAQQTAPQPKVEVTFDPAARSLTIADNGPGVDDAIAARLFVPFQSNKPQGFGIGLALVKKIAILHGATVSLRNGTVGAAATLDFSAV